MKGYKITNCAQDRRIGIVGCSFKDVFIKGCEKLKVCNKYLLLCKYYTFKLWYVFISNNMHLNVCTLIKSV